MATNNQKSSSFLAPIVKPSVVDTVVSRLTGGIMSGELKPGERIPTEMELAASLGVGRNSVREAVRILVSYGILDIRRADGTYVCEGFSPKILNPMLYCIILQKDRAHEELIGLRRMIDQSILQTLCHNGISEEDLEEIQSRQQDLDLYLHRKHIVPEVAAEKDIAFHHALATATHNVAVVTTYDTVVQITRYFLVKTTERLLRDHPQYITESHQATMDALSAGDASSLYQAVDKSYSFWYQTFAEQT